jgi:magnesium-transporting ATPase (P-type)
MAPGVGRRLGGAALGGAGRGGGGRAGHQSGRWPGRASEAADRLRRVGPNQLVERSRKPAWQLLAEQFANTMIVVLPAAAAVPAVIGELKERP